MSPKYFVRGLSKRDEVDWANEGTAIINSNTVINDAKTILFRNALFIFFILP